MGLFGFLFDKKSKDSNKERKAMMRADLKAPGLRTEEDKLVIKASLLMSSSRFKESLETFLELAARFAERKGLYLSQAGTNYYFLDEYEKAIECYLAAREYGIKASMIDDNIWDAIYELYSKTRDKNYLRRYIELCPQGAYVNRVNKLV